MAPAIVLAPWRSKKAGGWGSGSMPPRGHFEGHAAAGPTARHVVPTDIGHRALGAPAGAAHVDDVGVDCPDVVDVDPQLGADGRQVRRHEDVRRADDGGQGLASAVGGQVTGDAALAPVGDLNEGVGSAAAEVEHVEQRPLRVAVGRFDLDDVGPEVGQHGAGGRHEGPVGHLDDAHSLQRASHDVPDLLDACDRHGSPPAAAPEPVERREMGTPYFRSGIRPARRGGRPLRGPGRRGRRSDRARRRCTSRERARSSGRSSTKTAGVIICGEVGGPVAAVGIPTVLGEEAVDEAGPSRTPRRGPAHRHRRRRSRG